MMKLIASDLDGTLLQPHSKEVPDRLFPYIKKYSESGGLFVAASGRQYANLRRLFAPVQDDIAYICENGCLVIYKDTILYHAHMPRSTGEEILKGIQSQKDCEILLSGVDTCYIQPQNPSYETYIKEHVKNNTTVVNDIFSVKEPYFKISVYNPKGIEHSEKFFYDTFQDQVNVVTSGNAWLDMMPKGIHKGSALAVLSESLNIPFKDMMAIGDHYNDLEMLQIVGYPTCVSNAQPGIKDICKFEAVNAADYMIEKMEEAISQ